MRASFLIITAGLLLGAPGRAQVVDLAGEWRYLPHDGAGDLCAPAIDDRDWPVMRLPSSWFLLGRKEYPPRALAGWRPIGDSDPAELLPFDAGQGLDWAGTVWFRRTVRWDGAHGAHVLLDLDMVDYYAEASVNGVPIGRHEGYFQRFSLDATSALRPGVNLICVRVSAPALVFDLAQAYPVSWPRYQNQVKGVFLYHDTRPGATSWRGQERGTGGILRGVRLRASAGLDLEELTVTPLDDSAASARLVIEAHLRNWTGAPIAAAIEGEIVPHNFSAPQRLPVRLALAAPPGASRARAEVRLERPALWWSWDYGRPHLYRLTARLLAGGRLLDQRTARFGVRAVTRDAGWVFRLNGQRIYPRGSNYIATQWLSQADRAFYERDARMMIAAHLNSVRVHAHLERPEFYEIADELGLMVWQDFPLQWGYTDLPAFRDEALRQLGDMIVRYHNHPSILVWCLHNEAPHAAPWMKRRRKDQNLALDNALLNLAGRLDPARVLHRDSGTGDGHSYLGWYEATIGAIAPLPADMRPFITEYGAQALPGLATLRSMFAPAALWPDTPEDWEAWKFADFQPETTFRIARVDPGRRIEDFIASSQRYQANLVRYHTEVLRRAKWTRNTGLYHFMFVDDWPSISFGVVDYYRRPKPGYQALRDAMQRLLPSIEYGIEDPARPVVLHIVNDHLTAFPGATVRWRLKEEPGRAGPEGRQVLDIPADSVTRVADLGPLPQIARGRARLEVWVVDRTGARLGRSELSAKDFVLR